MGEHSMTADGRARRGSRRGHRNWLWQRRGRPGLALAVVAAVGAGAFGVVSATGTTRVAPRAVVTPNAVGLGPFTVDTSSREASRQFYNQVHEASNGVTDGWTGGSVSPGCVPGSVSPAFLEATLRRVNYFRAMSGVSAVTFAGTDPNNPIAGTSSDPNNAQAQLSSVMEAANGNMRANPIQWFLVHGPEQVIGGVPTKCWTQQAADASNASNLSAFFDRFDASVIDGWMNDGECEFADGCANGGAANDSRPWLGHRRNAMDPAKFAMGMGAVPLLDATPNSSASLFFPNGRTAQPAMRDGFVAWPPSGFVPYQVVYKRWSFSIPTANADFSNATVSMTRNGNAIGTTVSCRDGATGNCQAFSGAGITWKVGGFPLDGTRWPKPAADDKFVVTIGGVKVNGAAIAPIAYPVTVFDPAATDAAHTLPAPQGPTSPNVNSNPTYTVPALGDPNVSGYQWRTTPLAAGDVADGAENGLDPNWTATTQPAYNPVSTLQHATGSASFRLSSQGTFTPLAAPAPQFLTLKQTLFPQADSKLTFDSMYVNADTQKVEVSTDGGTTWQAAYTELWSARPTVETSFSPRTVSLGAFAGRSIRLRFSLTHSSGGWFNCCGEPNGWYIDNIALTNVQTAGTPVLSAVGANPSFVFNNSSASRVAIDVRPQYSNGAFGSTFLDWSPSLVVTSVVAPTGLVTLTSSANPSAQDAEVTYTATVAPTDGGGTVSFTQDGTPISGCQSLALTANKATCSRAYSVNGPYAIVATYSGDGAFNGSASQPLSQSVNAPGLLFGTLHASKTNVLTNEQITLTASVLHTDGLGTVSFNAGGTIPGCGAVPLTATGEATCVYSSPTNSHPLIEAVYNGSPKVIAGVVGNELVLVTARTTTTIASSANPSTPGQAVTFTATVSPATSSAEVQFFDNQQPMVNAETNCLHDTPDGAGKVTCTWTFDSPGPHSVQALFTGSSGLSSYATSMSVPVQQEVGTLSASSVTLASSKNPVVPGDEVTYTATVTGSGGAGSVMFTDNGMPILGCDAVALTAGKATCANTYDAPGSHPIVASYVGATGIAGSTSSVVTETVAVVAPAAPTGVTGANGGDGAAQVVFGGAAPGARAATVQPAAAPALNGVTGFNVYMGTSPGGESATPVNASRIVATADGFIVKGLTNGKKYYFVVRAQNRAGVGPKSAEVSVTPVKAPNAPTNLKAVPGRNSAALTWTAPSGTGGKAITGYQVYRSTVKGAAPTKPLAVLPASARSYTAAGLVPGTKYFFTVKAANGVVVSPSSNEASATPGTLPDTPIYVAAYAAKASAVVTWAAPAPGALGRTTGFNVYKATASHGQTATPVNASPLAATATSFVVPNLTNGKKYFFTVKAINATGMSAASNEVSATPTTAATAPGMPRNVVATSGNQSVALKWAAPASNGGKPITGYNVYRGTLASRESYIPVNASPLPASATTYNAAGLTNGAPYFFFVKAINAVGLGVPSAEVSTTPQRTITAPGAPTKLLGSAQSTKAALSWTAPSWTGGSPITAYNVYMGTTPGGQSSTPVNGAPLPSSARTFTVTGLANGTKYYLTVKAVNAVGASVASNQVKVVPG